jgi:hypothetical protein
MCGVYDNGDLLLQSVGREISLLAKGVIMGEKWPVKFSQTI